MKAWIIATHDGRVVCTNGDFRRPGDCIYHDQMILHRQGPYATAREFYDFLSQPGIDLRKMESLELLLCPVPASFSKIGITDLKNPVFTITLTAKNQLQVTEIATGKVKRSWPIKEYAPDKNCPF